MVVYRATGVSYSWKCRFPLYILQQDAVQGDYLFRYISMLYWLDVAESTTDVGQGNYMPALEYDNRTDMVYAVFNTPR